MAWLRGGSPRHLAALPVRGVLWLMASLAIQLLLYLPPLRASLFVLHWSGAIYIAALTVALIGAGCNWHLGAPARIAILGLVLNMTVIIANGGHMPVGATAMRHVQGAAKVREIAAHQLYGNTSIATRSSQLLALSDVISVRLPGRYGNVYSIGDMLLVTGVAALAYRGTYRRRPKVVV
jgi:hypothetical protein